MPFPEENEIWNAAAAQATAVLQEAAGAAAFSGAVLAAQRAGQPRLELALGNAQASALGADLALYGGSLPRAMRSDALFDLASLTKVLATTWAVLQLCARGSLAPESRAGEVLPILQGSAWGARTVRQLLQHRSGAPAWRPLYVHRLRREDVPLFLAERVVLKPAEAEYCYSDLNFILLAALVERCQGRGLDQEFAASTAAPLGLQDACFCPGADRAARLVATSHGALFARRMLDDRRVGLRYDGPERSADFDGWRGHTLCGEVNDCNAHHVFGGVAGHAGLFGTAAAVLRLCDAFWQPRDALGVGPALRQRCLDLQQPGGAWGWQALPPVPGAPPDALWHRGFTGTLACLVPAWQLSVALLSNRQHPHADARYVDLTPLYGRVLEIVFAACRRAHGQNQ